MSSCGDCRFWMRNSDTHGYVPRGLCRRFPPQFQASVLELLILEDRQSAAPDKEQADAVFREANAPWVWMQPITQMSDYCGEWRFADEAAS